MFKREEKIQTVGSISYFMNNEHNKKAEVKKDRARANKFAVASTLVPLASFAPSLAVKTFAAESVSNCGQAIAVAAPQAVTTGASAVVGKASFAALAHIFDPLIQLIMGISFPVASALILFKLFMGFFRDQGEVWEGIGRISLVYVLIQMFPVFTNILKGLGGIV